jgi:hypothetical protein
LSDPFNMPNLTDICPRLKFELIIIDTV